MTKRIYFDHNATTPLHPEVKKVITEALESFGNPSSLHSFGRESRQKIEEARTRISSFIGAHEDELCFVASGSEANNTVLSIPTCNPNICLSHAAAKSHIIVTTIEHPCILETAKCFKKRGQEVTFLKVDNDGKIHLDELEKTITSKTALVSVMMANNEIGTIQDIKTIARIVHNKGALFHTDAVQAVGKIPVDVKDLDVDFLTISAHKIYGPKGIGALYVRKGVPFCPFIRGGHQEKGRRAGTENTIGILGLSKAIEMRTVEMESEGRRLLELKKILKDGIAKEISEISFNGHPTDCLPGTLNVSFDGVEGEAILLYLDLEGIAVSTGSACATGSLDPSHVLIATGCPVERAHGSIRISLGRDNTADEIKFFISKIKDIIRRLRNMSSAYDRRKP